VVDLQSLGLDSITKKGNDLEIGATCTLQSLLESEHSPEALKVAIKLEAPINIRNSATVAGTLSQAMDALRLPRQCWHGCEGNGHKQTSVVALGNSADPPV
jgi:putative selenate reductase FAD-binding subunit